MTPEDREEVADVAKMIVEAATPLIIKAIVTAREGVVVHAVSELLSAEPAGMRDYRKELWIKAFIAAESRKFSSEAAAFADRIVALFDARFPP